MDRYYNEVRDIHIYTESAEPHGLEPSFQKASLTTAAWSVDS